MKRQRKAIVSILILALLSATGCASNNNSNTAIRNQQTPENSKITDAAGSAGVSEVTEKRRDIMNLGYTVHPDNPKVIIGEYQYKEPILTKKDWILSDKSGSTTVEYGGLLYYSIP